MCPLDKERFSWRLKAFSSMCTCFRFSFVSHKTVRCRPRVSGACNRASFKGGHRKGSLCKSRAVFPPFLTERLNYICLYGPLKGLRLEISDPDYGSIATSLVEPHKNPVIHNTSITYITLTRF